MSCVDAVLASVGEDFDEMMSILDELLDAIRSLCTLDLSTAGEDVGDGEGDGDGD